MIDLLGLYLKQISKFPMFSREEENALAVSAQAGDLQAQHDLVRSQLKLVVYVARRYQGRGIELEDLICIGNEGLVWGVRKFDPAAGTRLSTYAYWWIEQRISRALEYKDFIRLPSHFRRPQFRDQDYCREIAALVRHVASLDIPDPKSGKKMIDQPDDGPAPVESVIRRDEIRQVREALAQIDDRQSDILTRRSKGDSLDAIADDYELSRERIRQLESKGMANLANLFGRFDAEMSLTELEGRGPGRRRSKSQRQIVMETIGRITGWTPVEMMRRAKMTGLTLPQVLEALTEVEAA
jgi:RNA polymerase sigma factor (sigma-70 family)